jgi:hypothetical protein
MSKLTDGPTVPPPAPTPTGKSMGLCVPLKQLWKVLPEGTRRQALRSLGQVVIRQVLQSRPGSEVQHDRR